MRSEKPARIAIAVLLLSTACAFAAEPAAPNRTVTSSPDKIVTLSLPLSDVVAIARSVADSAVISARDAARINQAITAQVQSQLAPPKK